MSAAGETAGAAPAREGEAIVEMRDVHAAYHGDIAVLQGVTLTARRGEITGIIGPNGAGKSTVLKTLCGFLRPTRGEIRLMGESVEGARPSAMVGRGLAYVPQNRSLFGELSVEDNLRLGCWSFRRDRARVEAALERVYAQFPILKDRRRARAGAMSGGQQRFLELGRGLVLEPEVMLLDEPTAMIAPKVSRELYEFIRTLPERGISVILVDQNVRQCAAVSDRLVIMELGATRAEATTDEISGDADLKAMIGEWLDYRID